MTWRNYTPATSSSQPEGYNLFQQAYVNMNSKRLSSFSTKGANDILVKKYLKSDFTDVLYQSPYRIPSEILMTYYYDSNAYASSNSKDFTGHLISSSNYTSPSNNICYARDKWFISTSNNKLWVSSDKTNWSNCVTFSPGDRLHKVIACGENEYIALCKDGKVYYSTNNAVSFSSYTWSTGSILDIFYDDVAGKVMVSYLNGQGTYVYLATMASISSSTISVKYSFDNSVINKPYLCGFNKRSDGKWIYFAPSISGPSSSIQVIDSLPTSNSWSGTTIASASIYMFSDLIRTLFWDDHLYCWSPSLDDNGNNISSKTNGIFVPDAKLAVLWVDTSQEKFYLISQIDYLYSIRSTSDFVTFTTETFNGSFPYLDSISIGFKDK